MKNILCSLDVKHTNILVQAIAVGVKMNGVRVRQLPKNAMYANKIIKKKIMLIYIVLFKKIQFCLKYKWFSPTIPQSLIPSSSISGN